MGYVLPRCERFIMISEMARVKEFVPYHGVWSGRLLEDRAQIERLSPRP